MTRTRLERWGAALVATATWLVASTALGQPQGGEQESMSQATTRESDMRDEDARRAFRLGRELYENGRFPEAAVEFERAYSLSGRAQLLYNAYLAFRDAGDVVNAARTLRAYLDNVPDAPDQVHLQARLDTLERTIAEREAQRQAAEEAAREAEEARRQAAEAERRAAEAAARPQFREVPGEVWPWAIVGVGGAMIGAGAITGALAITERGSLESSCPLQLCPAGFGTDGRQSTIRSLAVATDVLLIGGAVAAVTGLILGIALGPRSEAIAPGAPAVAAACTTEGCMAIVRGEL